MAKPWWLNSRRTGVSDTNIIWIGIFAVALVGFYLLPVFKRPLIDLWRSTALGNHVFSGDRAQLNSPNDCLVLAAPPQEKYDTILLECLPPVSAEAKTVWYVDQQEQFLVGRVVTRTNRAIVAQLFSSYDALKEILVRFSIASDKYSAVPLGNGTFRAEIPAGVLVPVNSRVYHAVSGHLLGVVAGVELEKGSFVQRVYIRMPFSFEKLRVLQVK